MTPIKWLTGIPMPYYFLTLALVLQLLPGFILSVSRAQGTPPPEGLAIGQPVPDDLVLEMVNYHAPTAKLSDFKGKLLILDFYATWCGTCKLELPKLDALQQEFSGQLQILPVSFTNVRDNRASVLAYFDKWRRPDGSRYQLPSVVDDTALWKLFPHKYIPYYAWIGPDGIVRAFTGPDKVTAQHIERAIKEGILPEPTRDIDLRHPLFADSTQLRQSNLLHYAILLKGKVDGAPSGMQLRRNGNDTTGLVITNMPLLGMYNFAKKKLYPAFGTKGLVLEGIDSASFFPDKSGLTTEAWKAQHTYSYDLVSPASKAENLHHILLEDLNRYSGYRANLETRETDCLLLVRKGRKDKLKSKGGKPESSLYSPVSPSMQNLPIAALIARLNGNNVTPLLVLDQTGYKGAVDLELKTGFSDLAALRKELQSYGLDLVNARRKVQVLVLRKELNTGTSSLLFLNN